MLGCLERMLLRHVPIQAVQGLDEVFEGRTVSSVQATLDAIMKFGLQYPLLFLEKGTQGNSTIREKERDHLHEDPY